MGYARAGWSVVGVDIAPQPRYPFPFRRADAMTFPLDGFDAVHASPPCHDHSPLRHRTGKDHGTGWMLSATIERLRAWGGPWIVENVAGAVMPADVYVVQLCGSSFGLRVRRHRLFATNVAMLVPGCDHARQGTPVGVYGHGGSHARRTSGGRGTKAGAVTSRILMDMPWASHCEVAQAVPPAYTEHLGAQLLAAVMA